MAELDVQHAVADARRREHVVAFDVDGTLTTRDCVVPFLRRVAGTPRLTVGLARRPLALGAAGCRRDRDQLKAMATCSAFRGRRLDAVSAIAERFADEVHDRYLRAEVADRLRAHIEAGDRVVLVSASYELYLVPLGRRLGVDAVLGTRLVVDTAGVLTGEIDGPNCRAGEKVRRLDRWLGESRRSRQDIELTVYGDSSGDRELLLDADHAQWVGTLPAPAWMPRR